MGSVGGSPAKGITIRPVQVNIGIVVSAASLFGFTDTPGHLMDRSSLVADDAGSRSAAGHACTNPICAVPSWRSDQDHVIPAPEGATTASNLDEKPP